MIETLDLINQYGTTLLLLGQIGMAVAMLYLKGQFAPKGLENDVKEAFATALGNHNGLDRRILALETRIRDIPKIADLHKLEREIAELRGDLKRMDENIDGTEGLLTRLERQVERMEDFLKREQRA